MMDNSIRRGSLEMTAAMLISGTIGWFVLVRAAGAGCGVLALRVRRRHLAADLRRVRLPAPGILTRTTFLLAVLSGVAIVGNWVLLFASYSRASIAIGTAVYNVQPFMLVGLAALFLGEKITCRSCSGWAFPFSACWRSSAPMAGRARAARVSAGHCAGAGRGVALRDGGVDHQAPDRHAAASDRADPGLHRRAAAGAVRALRRPAANTGAWASLVTLGIVHTGLMYVLLYGAIQKLPTALTGALSFIYPIAAIFVDWFAFGHRLQPCNGRRGGDSAGGRRDATGLGLEARRQLRSV
jgi:uncharacterized membrane protein